MAGVTLTRTNAPGRWSTTGTAVTMTAAVADAGDENDFDTGNDLLVIAHNTDAGAQTVTITSVADSKFGRTGDVLAQSLAASEIRMFRLTNAGWTDSSGKINIAASSANVNFGIVVL
jgi:hypothetical protein